MCSMNVPTDELLSRRPVQLEQISMVAFLSCTVNVVSSPCSWLLVKQSDWNSVQESKDHIGSISIERTIDQVSMNFSLAYICQ